MTLSFTRARILADERRIEWLRSEAAEMRVTAAAMKTRAEEYDAAADRLEAVAHRMRQQEREQAA